MKLNIRNALIRGTLILTAAGLLSRILGFFYRIYLTRSIGSEGIGLFQLVTPVMGIVFALCSAGIQTGISKFAATGKKGIEWLVAGLLLSLPLSITASFTVYAGADYIAAHFLLNPDSAGLLRILAISFPFSTFHNCVNGYYYGKKCASIPAISQLLEQIVRILTVYGYSIYCQNNNIPITAMCAVYGNIIGEIASFIFCVITLLIHKQYLLSLKQTVSSIKTIFVFSTPLTFNKLLMHLLQSGEAILIPAQLVAFGHNQSEALSIYGVLNGMVLPLILFPCAITNSMAVMLLPEISHAHASEDEETIVRTIKKSIYLCIVMGIISTLLFVFYGASVGAIIFDEPLVYNFSLVIAWLCPFVYLTTTLGSIINGLGFTTTTCIHNILCIIIRIIFLILLVPSQGITAYLLGLLIAQIFICFAHYIKISRIFRLNLNPYDLIVTPLLYCLIAVGISFTLYDILCYLNIFNIGITQLICAGFAGALSIFLIYKSQKYKHN